MDLKLGFPNPSLRFAPTQGHSLKMSFKPFFSVGKRSFCRRHSSKTRKCCWVSGVRTRRL